MQLFDDDKNLKQEAISNESGEFEFKSIENGNYKIKVSPEQKKYYFQSTNSEISCKVSNMKVNCQGSLEITGSDVEGYISYENQPVDKI